MVLLLYLWVFNPFGPYFGGFLAPVSPSTDGQARQRSSPFSGPSSTLPKNIGCSHTSVSWNEFWNQLVKLPDWSLGCCCILSTLWPSQGQLVCTGLTLASPREASLGSQGSFPALSDACWLLSEGRREGQQACGAASLHQPLGLPLGPAAPRASGMDTAAQSGCIVPRAPHTPLLSGV